MERQYRHLSAEDRAVVMIEHRKGVSLRSIARELRRSASTISRELRRNGLHDDTGIAVAYDQTTAAMAYRLRRQRCTRARKLAEGTALHQHVHDRLVYWRWSPQQIAARLRRMHPNDPLQVRHETIYAAIYAHPRGALKKSMVEALRQTKPVRARKRTTLAKDGTIPEALRIVHRPEDIEQRQLPGHWEGDFIKGTYNRSAVGTLVERKTRYVVLCRMDGCTAQDGWKASHAKLKKLPAFLRESLTYDRGSEMACHVELAQRLNIDIWFADPYAP
jgi:IS30 family transposase